MSDLTTEPKKELKSAMLLRMLDEGNLKWIEAGRLNRDDVLAEVDSVLFAMQVQGRCKTMRAAMGVIKLTYLRVLARKMGEEGERRGRPKKGVIVDRFSDAELQDRKRAWKLGGTEERVRQTEEWMKEADEAGIPITVKGAIQNIEEKEQAKVIPLHAEEEPKSKADGIDRKKVTRPRSSESRQAKFMDQLEAVADGKPHHYVKRGHNQGVGQLAPALNSIDAVDWLSMLHHVERDDEAGTVTIYPLPQVRELIDGFLAGTNITDPEALKVGALARRLRDGIKAIEEDFRKQREAAARGHGQSYWNTDAQMLPVLREIVAWVKEELDRVLKD